jgi:subtilase family serine protease
MSTFVRHKKIFFLIGLMMPCLQSIAEPNVPSLPDGYIPRAPYQVISKHATLTPGGISPAQIRKAYGFPDNFTGAGETIALVEAGDDPNIESDLNTFSAQFGLPACTTANGCFSKVFADDTPPPDSGWAIETSLDVEWAHAIAPQAKILVVEGYDASDLYFAVIAAAKLNPSVMSLSWGGGEFSTETSFDQIFVGKIPIFAASGDGGHGVWYPASSPYVIGVGATQISMDASGNYLSETAWNGSGGGVSAYEPEPAYQSSYVIPQAGGMRGEPDVSYNGSGGSPYAVYDSFNEGGWLEVAGTSAAAPQWAALAADMMAAKNGKFNNFNQSIYSVARETNPLLLHLISTGNNGSCGFICNSRTGYDYITGLGTPYASPLINRFD